MSPPSLKHLLAAYKILVGGGDRDLADEFGVSVQVIRQWLKGENYPHKSMGIEYRAACLIHAAAGAVIASEVWTGYGHG